MLQASLVTFREGLESLLIVGVIGAFLRKTGRTGLIRGMRIGLAVSVVTCLIGAYLWQLVPNQPLYEGVAAVVAAILVGLLLVQMVKMGRHMRRDIESRVARASGAAEGRVSLGRTFAIALVTMLLVTREGLEAVLYLGIQARMSGSGRASLIGAAIGLAVAGGAAWIWSHTAHRLNLGVVLKVTAVFLALFLFQLVVYGVHELAESGIIEGSQRFHDATEIVGPDGAIGHVISYSLLAAPLLYLVLSRRSASSGRRPPPPEPV
jgi:high-affinity iron transporter